jgi:hypothetical protein
MFSQLWFWAIRPCKSSESEFKFRRCMSSSPSGLKRSAYCMLRSGILVCLLFNPEDGGNIFLRNVGWLPSDYTALYSRKN